MVAHTCNPRAGDFWAGQAPVRDPAPQKASEYNIPVETVPLLVPRHILTHVCSCTHTYTCTHINAYT